MNLKEILKEVFALKDEQFSDKQSILDLEQFDSMNHMVFITRLEEEFNIELMWEDIEKMITIGEIKSILQSKGITV